MAKRFLECEKYLGKTLSQREKPFVCPSIRQMPYFILKGLFAHLKNHFYFRKKA